MKEDKWKENFLVRIHDEATVEKKELNNHILLFLKDDEFTVWGLPFYNEKDVHKAAFNKALTNVAADISSSIQ